MNSPLKGRLLLLAAAAFFSTGGAAIKAASVGGWQIACFRSGVAALFLLAVIPESRRFRWRMLPVAACFASTLVFFVLANRLTTAANAIFLQSTAPLYVLLLGPLLLREPIRRQDVGFVAAVACGIACLFIGSPNASATAPDPRRGNLFAIGAGLSYAFTLVGLRWLSRKHEGGAIATVALGNLLACVAALAPALPVPHMAVRDFAILLYLGTVQIGVAYVCLARGIRNVPAVEAATLLMAEPALNPVWTWLVHRENPGTWALAGGALIVCVTLKNTWRTK